MGQIPARIPPPRRRFGHRAIVETLRPSTYLGVAWFISRIRYTADIQSSFPEEIGEAWLALRQYIVGLKEDVDDLPKEAASRVCSKLQDFARDNSWNIYVPSSTKDDQIRAGKTPAPDLINRGDIYFSDPYSTGDQGKGGWNGIEYWNDDFYGSESVQRLDCDWNSKHWPLELAYLADIEANEALDLLCENETEKQFLLLRLEGHTQKNAAQLLGLSVSDKRKVVAKLKVTAARLAHRLDLPKLPEKGTPQRNRQRLNPGLVARFGLFRER